MPCALQGTPLPVCARGIAGDEGRGDHDTPGLGGWILHAPEERLEGSLRDRRARLMHCRERRRDERRQVDVVHAGDVYVVGATFADLRQEFQDVRRHHVAGADYGVREPAPPCRAHRSLVSVQDVLADKLCAANTRNSVVETISSLHHVAAEVRPRDERH